MPIGALPEPAVGDLFARLLLIRRTEESLLDLFSQGKVFGTTHTSIGQEAIAVAVMSALDLTRDVVFSSHRCHGHFLAYGGDLTALFAEVMGRATGVCGGVGGSQHLQLRNFYSNGVQGGIVPLAVGAALAERHRGTGAIATVFLGDGTLGEGVVYEALNMASLWNAPVLFVLEDNLYAQSTPRELGVAGSLSARAEAFGVAAGSADGNDVHALVPLLRDRVRTIREGGRPFFQVLHTYRLAPHSKGDDDRDPAEIAARRGRDPIVIARQALGAEVAERIETHAMRTVQTAVAEADAAPWPDTDIVSTLIPTERTLIPGRTRPERFAEPDPFTGKTTVARELNAALHAIMGADERVILIGEDVLDPYGGAFKIAKGLSTKFRGRVYTTPISEAGLVGVANGMALRGMRPVAEIMFGDFTTLAADQIINHAAKFEAMYNRRVRCPITIRTPMGGRRGYGPTHSQSVEALFFNVPGLEIVAPSPLHSVGALLENAVLQSERPTLFVENKMMYPRPLLQPDANGQIGPFAARYGAGGYPTVHLSADGFRTCDLVLIAYGGSVELVMAAAEHLLIEHEIACDILALSQVAPVPLDDLFDPVQKAGRALVVEEGHRAWGWGAEVSAALYESAGASLTGGAIGRVAARPFVLTVSRPLEDHVLPQVQDVASAARALVAARRR